jgi:DNA-directed RNA polymerase
LLQAIVQRGLDVQKIVADRAISSDDEGEGIIKALSQAAVSLGLSRIVSELGRAESLGYFADPLEGVPEVNPVLKPRVCVSLYTGGETKY